MTDAAPAVPAAVSARLWDGIRVVVLDTETRPDPGLHAKDHIVSIGAVTLRGGATVGSWATLLDPGIAITNSRIHNLTDELVAGASTFPDVVGIVDDLLRSGPGERVLFVGHFAHYDWRVLGIEYHRIGKNKHPPEVDVLDTAKLAEFLAVPLTDRSLDTLADAVGVGNPNPHDALSDALTTAAVFLKLLDRAVAQGITEMQVIVEGSAKVTSGRRPSSPVPLYPGLAPDESVEVPATHLDTHLVVLPARAGRRQVDAWLDGAAACVTLRCPHLHDKVELALTYPGVARAVTTGMERLIDRAAVGGGPCVATLLDVLTLGWRATLDRSLVAARYDEVATIVEAFDRCDPERLDACPNCRTAAPCALDTWHLALAEVYARGLITPAQRRSFLSSTFPAWVRNGRGRLAGAVAWAVAMRWQADGDDDRAVAVARTAHQAGVADPRLAALLAESVAEPGTTVALRRAAKVCDDALASRKRSTDPGWATLAAKRRQFLSQRAELLSHKHAVAAGVRAHTPAAPRRTYPSRFTPR